VLVDALRPPPPLEPTRATYKDWLHLNVFDPASGVVALVNASLHGAPDDPRARAIGTALAHVPDVGWAGNVEVAGYADAALTSSGIALPQIAVALDRGAVLASARFPDDGLVAVVTATARSAPIAIELPLPFGSGWISWTVAPRLAVSGSLRVADRDVDLSRAVAYHDHNWGRWRWGDDAGWEWGAFAAADDGPLIVVARTCDRAHRALGPALCVVDAPAGRRTFAAGASLALDGRLAARARRLPGALAALHQDRSAPPLPSRVRLRAGDGIDAIELEFRPRAAAQLIAAEPTARGYGFVHELAGSFVAHGRLAGAPFACEGLGVFEYVD
jgi:hypothetical protein